MSTQSYRWASGWITFAAIVLSVAVFDLWVGSSFTRVAALSLIQALIIFLVLLIARRIGRAGALVVQ